MAPEEVDAVRALIGMRVRGVDALEPEPPAQNADGSWGILFTVRCRFDGRDVFVEPLEIPTPTTYEDVLDVERVYVTVQQVTDESREWVVPVPDPLPEWTRDLGQLDTSPSRYWPIADDLGVVKNVFALRTAEWSAPRQYIERPLTEWEQFVQPRLTAVELHPNDVPRHKGIAAVEADAEADSGIAVFDRGVLIETESCRVTVVTSGFALYAYCQSVVPSELAPIVKAIPLAEARR